MYAADLDGFLHCLDAKTGKIYWQHDLGGAIWSSPYYVDGKVFMGDEDGDVFVFAAGKEKKSRPRSTWASRSKIPPVAANGVLYITNGEMLYAIPRSNRRVDPARNHRVHSLPPNRPTRDPRSGPHRPANGSTPTSARSSSGTSTPRPARRSGSSEAKTSRLRPAQGSQGFDDLKKFGLFEDEWLRGGPVRRWVPKGLQDKPIYVFETGGTTGIPKSRVVIEDFRIDYEMFSETLPDKYLPQGRRTG